MTLSSAGANLLPLLLALLPIAIVYASRRRRRAVLYPPGPPKHFLLGNLLDVPTKSEWETYTQWGKDYNSDIVHAQVAGHHIVVLNSVEAANDLLDKRSAIYSSRPRLVMISELMGYEWFLPIIKYGKEWKERRTLFQSYFSNRNAGVYQATQRNFVYKMLQRVLEKPHEFFEITENMVGGSTISLTYGLDVKDNNDPFVDLGNKGIQSVAQAGAPGTFFVDLLPWLKYVPEWVPGAGFQKQARIWRKLQEDVREAPFVAALKAMESQRRPSFLSQCLEDLAEGENREHQIDVIKDTLSSVFAAGSDTTLSAVHSFFVAMLFYPEVQVRAQQELDDDRVLKGRLPDFDDEANLPYTTAIVKEVLRWKPVSPLGVPHCATENDIYRGFFIPKGTILVSNLWAMLYDEDRYPNPQIFMPERFLTGTGELNADVLDPVDVAFGFGRRLCPGRNVAVSILWLTVATVLATFQISKAVDEEGVPIEPSVEYDSGLIYRPLLFKCTIKPRSKTAEELIHSVGNYQC